MEPIFRKSMAWLHTWAGVVIGSVLLAIFWMGSLSVFDREIDRWMMPGTRLPAAIAEQPFKLDGPITETATRLAQGSPQWFIRPPSERVPMVELRWRDEAKKTFERRYLHPQTGEVLETTDTLGGTGFIFPFHYSLHMRWRDVSGWWKDLGYWVVGLSGMAMLVLIVSGVVIHRKIFADFFLFRPRKQLQRASLDLHNLTGVLALPFHFVITLSGLIIFFSIYWPSAYQTAYTGTQDARKTFVAEAFGQYRRAKAGQDGPPLASLDAMVAHARSEWQGDAPNFIRVWHPGDANSYVEMSRGYANSVTMHLDQWAFDAATGQVLHRFKGAPVMTVERFISGLHFIQFRHWTLRWLYFAAGLAGCVMISTGFLFWLESRRASHAKKGLAGVRVVEALTIASVPGLIAATLVFFCANRLLPADAAFAGYERVSLEMWAFYLAWLAALLHAAIRAKAAWREQTWAVALLALLAVVLNWASTPQHLLHSLEHGLWSVAGVDIALLLVATLAVWIGRRLQYQRLQQQPIVKPRAARLPDASPTHAQVAPMRQSEESRSHA